MNAQFKQSLIRRIQILSLLLITVAAHADRPRVGLVLGGGGARGAAHIGVLKELERQHIPVDVIAGTSMGAIVGGLYASGVTPDELEEIVTSLNWAVAMSDSPARSNLSYRRKQDHAQYPIGLELGIRDSELLLPMGLVEGQELDLILRELTVKVSNIDDFDALPIPFRAVATDIVTGEAYVMGRGDLARSIRASMSVPAILAPALVDGHLLVDGGIAANLPIDVLRSMDVDIIIAVDVEFPLYTVEELDSGLAISEQMLTALMHRETVRQIETLSDNDVLIQPKLGTFDSGNFADIAEAIDPGVVAAREASARLSSIALDEDQFAEHLAQRSRPRLENSRLAFVRVIHDGRTSPGRMESILDVHAGDLIDAQRLAAAAEKLFGHYQLEQVSYKLVEENGATGAEFQARAKSWGPNILKFAVSLENDFEGSSAFNIGTRLTKVDINTTGAEWQTDLRVGTDPRLRSEFYLPLGESSRWFLAPRVNLQQSNLYAFAADDRIARYRLSESELGFDIGAQIGLVSELRLGGYRGSGRARVKVGDPTLPNLSFDTGGFRVRFGFDTLDDAQFPRQGMRANLNWDQSSQALGADERLAAIEIGFEKIWSRGKNSWLLGVEYATTNDTPSGIQDLFQMGGFLRLSGLERGEISGPHSALARLMYYRRISESTGGLLDVPMYVGMSAEIGNVWQTRSDMSFDTALVNGSIYAGFDTIIGPVYLAVGFAEGGSTNYYMFFGEPPR
jgi:NTE family protein